MSTEREVVSVAGLCEMLGISTRKAYRMLDDGEIPARRAGKKWLIGRQAVLDWLANDARGKEVTPQKEDFIKQVPGTRMAESHAPGHSSHT